jgi:acetyl esterase
MPLPDSIGRPIARGVLNIPQPILRRLAGPPRRNDEGHLLDVTVQALITLERMSGRPPQESLPVAIARAQLRSSVAIVEELAPRIFRIQDELANGSIPIRIYVPRPSAEPLPVVVYFHGGGFVLGDLETHDVVCRRLARDADCIVASVHYRLAPEHRFPAAVDDAFAAFHWMLANAGRFGGDATRVGVAGDSAGGNLAAAVSLLARDSGGKAPIFQLLVYPAVDFYRKSPSHRLFGTGFLLNTSTIDWFSASYAHRHEWDDFRASPLLAEDVRGVAPACVVTAGFDPLRDEGRAYVARLREAAVDVSHHEEHSLTHGFLNMVGVVTAARAANLTLARTLHAGLRS